jgi:hypothetical protein
MIFNMRRTVDPERHSPRDGYPAISIVRRSNPADRSYIFNPAIAGHCATKPRDDSTHRPRKALVLAQGAPIIMTPDEIFGTSWRG